MICTCGHSKFIHPFGGACQVLACTCTGIDLDPDPYRSMPDCRCGHSAWVHLNEDGEQVIAPIAICGKHRGFFLETSGALVRDLEGQLTAHGEKIDRARSVVVLYPITGDQLPRERS